MWIRFKMKSAWKLTQGLDWEQPLFCSKICELVRYYAGKPRAARLSGHHHNSLLAAPPRASSTHKYITIAHGFSSKGNCSQSRGLRSFWSRALTLYLWIGLCPWVLFLFFNVTVNRARFYIDEQLICMQLNTFVFPLIGIHHLYLRELTQTWTHLHHHNPLLLQGLWEEKLLKHRSPRPP